ncbi:MAG: DUF4214 domain-containing protein [Lachnospiraceae bacterium]|nr:DUF4214 domain-containing protein [Lachnospiraceae bacterium]
MKFKRGFISIISAFLAVYMIINFVPPIHAEAEGAYWSADLFTSDRSKKGVQSYKDIELGNSSNIFWNVYMETGFPKDDKSDISSFTPWFFEGKKYYFKVPEGLDDIGTLQQINGKNVTVTVQLLLRYDKEKLRLIEPSARGYSSFHYYSPNMTESAVVSEYRAFMDFLSEKFSKNDCHVDAWICGNEVNAPDPWCFFGTFCMTPIGSSGRWAISNRNELMCHYVRWFDIVYGAVKGRNKKARVCLCVDHSWNESEGGKIIPTRDFINLFASKEGSYRDWCIAYHCYPADLNQPNIWSDHRMNPKDYNAQYVDGYNLEVLTNHIKNSYGMHHRILLTEQGFSSKKGADVQAASLVYTFYRAKYDDMVDAFHIMKFNGSGFELTEPAATIWQYLDDGDEGHEQWIFNQVKGILGINSWTDIVPNWKSQTDNPDGDDSRSCIFDGVDYSPVFDFEYYKAKHPEVVGYYTTDPVRNPVKFKDMFYYFTRYGMDKGHQASENFNLEEYKKANPGLWDRFGDDNKAFYRHFCIFGYVDESYIYAFIERFYVIILERSSDDEEREKWIEDIFLAKKTGADVAQSFINSQEFRDRNYSDDKYIRKCYQVLFNREPDALGYKYWIGKLESGTSREDVLAMLVNSEEYKEFCHRFEVNPGSLPVSGNQSSNGDGNDPEPSENIDYSPVLKLDTSNVDDEKLTGFVERIYPSVLARDGEEDGVVYWKNVIMSGKDIYGTPYDISTVISRGFFQSEEYRRKGESNELFVARCYAAFFDRDPRGTWDEPNYWDWVNQLNSGLISRQKLIETGFGHSVEFKALIERYGFVIIE